MKEEIIEKLIEYQRKTEKALDWPYRYVLDCIINDVIDIVYEVAE